MLEHKPAGHTVVSWVSIDPNSDWYDQAVDQAVDIMVEAGIDPEDLDDLGVDITDVTQSALMIALVRSEKLRDWFELQVKSNRISHDTEMSHSVTAQEFGVTLSDRDEAHRRAR